MIDALLTFAAATTPTLHPLLADPVQGEVDAVFRGFKDLTPKPWPQRFREMQASGGNIEIKRLRLERSDAIIVGAGTLTVNATASSTASSASASRGWRTSCRNSASIA